MLARSERVPLVGDEEGWVRKGRVRQRVEVKTSLNRAMGPQVTQVANGGDAARH